MTYRSCLNHVKSSNGKFVHVVGMFLVCYNVSFPSLELAPGTPGTQCRLVKPMTWIRGSIQKGAIQAVMDVAQLLVAITIRWVRG
jgi:hypothetical protein